MIPVEYSFNPPDILPPYFPNYLRNIYQNSLKVIKKNLNIYMKYIPRRDCHSIWGSRSVIIDAIGNIEFLKLSKLPEESSHRNEYKSINATRWFSIQSSKHIVKNIKYLPSEPLYICVRSNNWDQDNTFNSFNITFKPSVIREKDKKKSIQKLMMHMILLFCISSVWLLPYMISLIVATVSYIHGMKIIVTLIILSCSIVCSAPFMLTKKNRYNYYMCIIIIMMILRIIKLDIFQFVIIELLL